MAPSNESRLDLCEFYTKRATRFFTAKGYQVAPIGGPVPMLSAWRGAHDVAVIGIATEEPDEVIAAIRDAIAEIAPNEPTTAGRVVLASDNQDYVKRVRAAKLRPMKYRDLQLVGTTSVGAFVERQKAVLFEEAKRMGAVGDSKRPMDELKARLREMGVRVVVVQTDRARGAVVDAALACTHDYSENPSRPAPLVLELPDSGSRGDLEELVRDAFAGYAVPFSPFDLPGFLEEGVLVLIFDGERAGILDPSDPTRDLLKQALVGRTKVVLVAPSNPDLSARRVAERLGVAEQSVCSVAMDPPAVPSARSLPRPVLEAYAGGNLAILVGSGLSVAHGLPGWTDLPKRLLDEVARYDAEQEEWIARQRRACEPDSSLDVMLASFDVLKVALDRKYQAALNAIFRSVKTPGAAHRALIDLGVRLLATTNYDHLLEAAETPAARTTYTWRDSDKVLTDLEADRSVLYKIHGTADRHETVIMTRSEYTEASQCAPYRETIRLLLQRYTFLFVGYGMNDPFDLDLVFQLNEAAFKSAARTHYILMRGEEARPRDRDHWKRHFNVQVVPYDDHAELVPILRRLRASLPA